MCRRCENRVRCVFFLPGGGVIQVPSAAVYMNVLSIDVCAAPLPCVFLGALLADLASQSVSTRCRHVPNRKAAREKGFSNFAQDLTSPSALPPHRTPPVSSCLLLHSSLSPVAPFCNVEISPARGE